MSQAAPSEPTVHPPRRVTASTVVMGLMVLAFLVVVWQRNEIRAWWWTRQLAAAASDEAAWPYVVRLQWLGEASIRPLAGLHDHPDPAARLRAVETAGALAGSRASRVVITCALHDPDANNRRAAVLLLSERDDEGSRLALRNLVASGREPGRDGQDDVATRCTAVHALALSGDSDAGALLLRLLDQTAPAGRSAELIPLRVEIIHALGDLQADEAIGPLADCLIDESAFTGITERERNAAGMLSQALAGGSTGIPPGATLDRGERYVVGKCADDILYRLTGRPRDSAPPEGSSPEEIQASWRAWLAEHPVSSP